MAIGHAAGWQNGAFLGQAHALPAFGEAGSFKRESGHDAEGVVQFEEVKIIRADASLAVGGLG